MSVSDKSKFIGLSMGLIALQWVSLKLSSGFEYEIALSSQPITTWVTIQFLSGVLFLAACYTLFRCQSNSVLIALVILAGLSMRFLVFGSVPVLETDFYRYLWDGALLANGQNPYLFSPNEILQGGDQIPNIIQQIASDSSPILERVNHPDVTTIYPFIAISIFELAYYIKPWSIESLRVVYLFLDVFCVIALSVLLRSKLIPLTALFIFWCNPLFIRLTYNSLHMDIILMALIVLLLITIQKRYIVLSAAVLGAAIATKIWPIMLVIHLWVKERMKAAAMLGLVIGIGLLVPLLLHATSSHSGISNYAQSWEVNDLFFRGIRVFIESIGISAELGTSTRVAKVITVVVLIVTMFALYKPSSSERSSDNCLILMMGCFFILLPAPYPWYFLWLLPLLTVQPLFGFLALTATLPLYDLRFYFELRDMQFWFDTVIVPLEFSPLILLFTKRYFYLPHSTPSHSHVS